MPASALTWPFDISKDAELSAEQAGEVPSHETPAGRDGRQTGPLLAVSARPSTDTKLSVSASITSS
jgi:hypothetical protein